jgi:hypothetical protein
VTASLVEPMSSVASRRHPAGAVRDDSGARAIERVAEQLEARALGFERRRDARCVFATAYAHLSRRLARRLNGAGFAEPSWVTELATTFAGYYFRAVDGFDSGTLEPGAWQSVFEASRGGRTSVLEDLVLGLTAHIVNDLPRALCDVGLRHATGRSRLDDYQRLNDVLGDAIEGVQGAVTRRYDPLLGALDLIAGSSDELLTNYGLRLGRAAAWYNAERLMDPELRGAAEAAISRSPRLVLEALIEPPFWSLRCVARGARWVSHGLRRWPARDGRS